MSVKITWGPSTYPTIASYDVLKSGAATGPYTFVANVLHNLAGANYDAANGVFFYNDSTGALTDWYELVSIDASNNRSLPSAPIEPTGISPALTSKVKVDHNYGGAGALRYQTAAGKPVEQAVIRVYTKTNFDQGETNYPLAITMTDVNGNWVTPVNLVAGYTYTITFAKDGLYGVDVVSIVV